MWRISATTGVNLPESSLLAALDWTFAGPWLRLADVPVWDHPAKAFYTS